MMRAASWANLTPRPALGANWPSSGQTRPPNRAAAHLCTAGADLAGLAVMGALGEAA